MPSSTLKPDEIFLDYVEEGRCRLLVRWNITEKEKLDEQIPESAQTFWDYSERVIWWSLPTKYNTVEDVLMYLDIVHDEIMGWAMATETTFDGSVTKTAASAYSAKITTKVP